MCLELLVLVLFLVEYYYWSRVQRWVEGRGAGGWVCDVEVAVGKVESGGESGGESSGWRRGCLVEKDAREARAAVCSDAGTERWRVYEEGRGELGWRLG